MISYDFDYYQPTTIEEARELFHSLDARGKNPLYFSGGTEIITLGRTNRIVTEAVIDLKAIAECTIYDMNSDELTLGAALTLTDICEHHDFPLLNQALSQIADQTARNTITLGGNICGNIIYREAVLPFLLTESWAVITSPLGLKRQPIMELFNQKLQLKKGEFLVQVITKRSELSHPGYCVKKRRQWDVGYPLVSVAALQKNDFINFAFSGLCAFPFRNLQMEENLNHPRLSRIERVERAIEKIPGTILDDVHGSARYRQFVFKNTLLDLLDRFEGVNE